MAKVVLLRAVGDQSARVVELLESREVAGDPTVPETDYEVDGRRYRVTSFAPHDNARATVSAHLPGGLQGQAHPTRMTPYAISSDAISRRQIRLALVSADPSVLFSSRGLCMLSWTGGGISTGRRKNKDQDRRRRRHR